MSIGEFMKEGPRLALARGGENLRIECEARPENARHALGTRSEFGRFPIIDVG